MGRSPQCYIPSFMEFGPPILEKKIFERFLPYMGVAAILVMCPASCHQIEISLHLKAFIQNLVQNGIVVSEKIRFDLFMYTTLGQGQEMTLTFNTHIPSYIQLDVCSYQLFTGRLLYFLINPRFSLFPIEMPM